MFKHEGPARSARKNEILAGYLALIAGFVNSGGFVMVGGFTSHVTGAVGRFSIDLAHGSRDGTIGALLLVVAFFVGAFIASLVVESNVFRRTSGAYGIALLVEAILLGAFTVLAGPSAEHDPLALDAEALLLCLAMGMQNSLVTRLSGAVVRTTHLTGVLTDLGIEMARWYRWQRSRLLPQLPTLLPMRSPAERPLPSRIVLLGTIFFAFALGAIGGAFAVMRVSSWAMAVPAVAVLLAAAYAFAEKPDPPAAPATPA